MEDEQSSEYSDEEIGVMVDGRKLWIRGVKHETTCLDVINALVHYNDDIDTSENEWILAERWRGVERPLPSDAGVLQVLNAWGDAKHEVRLRLRKYKTESDGEDSGRESVVCRSKPQRERRRRERSTTPTAQTQQPHAVTLARLIAHQTKTIHQQIDKLREQEDQIDRLEDKTHKTRMEKHGRDYLLESYLRDLERNPDQIIPSDSQALDSQTANSDSGVGGSGTPPRTRITKKSRRERHLMREHYFTKELADICQENAERFINVKETSDGSSDELDEIREKIELWEKLIIVNRRLQKEEELVVRLTAKLERYAGHDEAVFNETKTNAVNCLERLDSELEQVSEEMERNAVELAAIESHITRRNVVLNELMEQLKQEEELNLVLENNSYGYDREGGSYDAETDIGLYESSVDTYGPVVYPLDTLV